MDGRSAQYPSGRIQNYLHATLLQKVSRRADVRPRGGSRGATAQSSGGCLSMSRRLCVSFSCGNLYGYIIRRGLQGGIGLPPQGAENPAAFESPVLVYESARGPMGSYRCRWVGPLINEAYHPLALTMRPSARLCPARAQCPTARARIRAEHSGGVRLWFQCGREDLRPTSLQRMSRSYWGWCYRTTAGSFPLIVFPSSALYCYSRPGGSWRLPLQIG